jgi:hypothetical protein
MALDFPSWDYLASKIGSAILETSLQLRIGYLLSCRCDLRIWTGSCKDQRLEMCVLGGSYGEVAGCASA